MTNPVQSNVYSLRSSSLDRRVSPRVAARLPVQLDCMGLAGSLRAVCSDVGPTGLCVETATPFAMESLRRVIVELGDGPPLKANAVARWQRENAAADAHLTGIQLVDLAPKATLRLRSFIYDRAVELATFLHENTDLQLEMDEALDLALFTRLAEFHVGHHIYVQDAVAKGAKSAFFVYRGLVRLETRYKRSRPIALERVERGGIFGGLPMIADVPHVTSAISDGEVVALEIDPRTFQHFQEAKPGLAHRLTQALMRQQASQMRSLVQAAIELRQAP